MVNPRKVDTSLYWTNIHRDAWRRTRESGFLEWKRVSTSVVVPILSGLIQWFAGVSLMRNLEVSIGAGLAFYAVLIFVDWYIRVRQVIVERDDRQLTIIATLQQQLEDLTKPPAQLFRGEILTIKIDTWQESDPSSMTVSAMIQVRHLGNETQMSIHGIQLWMLGLECASGLSVAGPYGFSSRSVRTHIYGAFNPVPLAVVEKARGKGTQWKFTFKDYTDKEYESEIFTKNATD